MHQWNLHIYLTELFMYEILQQIVPFHRLDILLRLIWRQSVLLTSMVGYRSIFNRVKNWRKPTKIDRHEINCRKDINCFEKQNKQAFQEFINIFWFKLDFFYKRQNYTSLKDFVCAYFMENLKCPWMSLNASWNAWTELIGKLKNFQRTPKISFIAVN